jgi:hypothetical protein
LSRIVFRLNIDLGQQLMAYYKYGVHFGTHGFVLRSHQWVIQILSLSHLGDCVPLLANHLLRSEPAGSLQLSVVIHGNHLALFVAQCHHGIDPRRSTRWYPSCKQGHS